MSSHGGSRNPEHTVFVGNIPYGVTEEMLTEIFSEVGPVKYFRLVTDKETGRQKGFGFCEYFDKDTAQSAIRNLGGHEVNGRHLRVDCTDASSEKGDRKGSSKPQGNKAEAQVVSAAEAAQAAQGMAAAIGSTNLGPGQDQITDALSKMPRAALFDIMAQMKGLIQQNQQQARQILVTNPSLTRALFQAQILLGMLKNPLSADAAAQPGPPQAVPQHMPQPVPAPQAQFPPVHIQSQHQHATAMRPQHPPSANTIAHFPNQDMQLQALPQQQQPGGSMLGGSQQGGSNSGAPQPMRHAPGHSMPGRGAPHPGPGQGGAGPGQGGPGPGPVAMQPGPAVQQYGGSIQGPPVAQAGQGMQGPGPGPGQAPVRRPHDPRMRGADPRQQAHPRPVQPMQQPQPKAQPQQTPAANLPAEQQKVLLNQIMQLSPAQIDGLPPEQKAQVLALQQQMRAQPSMLQ